MKTNTTAFLFLALAALLTGCPGSAGTLMNSRSDDLSFVRDQDVVYVSTDKGLTGIQVNGEGMYRLAESGYALAAMAPNRSVWAWTDSDTNLFLMYEPGGKLHQIPELNDRASGVAISPDGSLVAVTRHADFSLPQSQWTEDNRLYLIDTATRNVTYFEADRPEWLYILAWSLDGQRIYASGHQGVYAIDPGTGERTGISAIPHDDTFPLYNRPTTCEASGATLEPRGDEGLDINYGDGRVERLLIMEGKERGFHDYHSIFPIYLFTSSCDYVVFEFQRETWIVEVETGLVAPLIKGREPRFLP